MKADRRELSRKNFDKDAATYDQSPTYATLRPRYQDVLSEALRYESGNCLDVGCGTGVLLSMIAQQRKGALLYGVDLSEQMIRVAQARLNDKAKLTVSDSEKLPFEDAKFDLLTCTFSFHHYPNPKSVIAEMKRVLAPRGKLIIADPWIFVPLRQIINLLMPLRKSGDVKSTQRKKCATSLKLLVLWF